MVNKTELIGQNCFATMNVALLENKIAKIIVPATEVFKSSNDHEIVNSRKIFNDSNMVKFIFRFQTMLDRGLAGRSGPLHFGPCERLNTPLGFSSLILSLSLTTFFYGKLGYRNYIRR